MLRWESHLSYTESVSSHACIFLSKVSISKQIQDLSTFDALSQPDKSESLFEKY